MKNTLKKVAALALAVLMCVSVMVPSLSAATCPGAGNAHTVLNCEYTATTEAPTCNKAGQTYGTCNACNAKFFISSVNATGVHNWDMPAATCKEGVVLQKVCKDCNTPATVERTEHKWSAWTLTGVSVCTVGENIRRTCSDCGKVDSVVIPAEGHYFELSSYVAPVTCNEKGSATYLCVIKGCGVTKTVDILATESDHTYVSWTEYYKGVINPPVDPNFVEATCEKPGTMTVICKDCARTSVIADNNLKDHNWRTPAVEAVAPDCDKVGYAKYTICLNCRIYKALTASDELAAEETTKDIADLEIAKLHANPTVYGEILPTCTTSGSRLVKCPKATDPCTWVETITLPALGAHVYYPDVTDTEAQKEIMKKLGITGVTWASLDDALGSTDIATPSGNAAKIYSKYTAATCEKDAVVVWKCLNCAEKLLNVTSAQYVQCTETKEATPAGNDFVKFGHKYPSVANSTSATCTLPGVETFVCENGCRIDKNVNVSAYGHLTYVYSTNPATCVAAGSQVVKCNNTGCTFSETVDLPIDATAHTYEYYAGTSWKNATDAAAAGIKTAPTCTDAVTVTRKCVAPGCDKKDIPETVTLAATGHTYMDLKDANVAKKLAALVVADNASTTDVVENVYVDLATGSEAKCLNVGGCEKGAKYEIKCADCAMYFYHEVTEGFGGGHVKVYINGTAAAATCTTPEYSNMWYCKNSYCEFYFETYDEAVADMNDNTKDADHSVSRDVVSAPFHYANYDATKTTQTAVTYKDVPYSAIKDAKDLAKAAAVEAPVDAKGNVTRYVAIPGTSLIWVFKYTPDNHYENPVTTGGFYCTECTYNGADKVVYGSYTDHDYKLKDSEEASCLTYGYVLYECKDCFDAYQTNYAPVADHKYDLKSEAAATCTLTGYKLYECEDCGNVKTEHFNAKGHNTAANWAGMVITSACNDRAPTRQCAVCSVKVEQYHVGAAGTNCKVCQTVIPA